MLAPWVLNDGRTKNLLKSPLSTQAEKLLAQTTVAPSSPSQHLGTVHTLYNNESSSRGQILIVSWALWTWLQFGKLHVSSPAECNVLEPSCSDLVVWNWVFCLFLVPLNHRLQWPLFCKWSCFCWALTDRSYYFSKVHSALSKSPAATATILTEFNETHGGRPWTFLYFWKLWHLHFTQLQRRTPVI